MILIRRRVVVVVALSIMIFTATLSVLSGLRSAPSAFAGDSEFVISETSAPTIFSSQVGVDMVSALQDIPNITGASPEVFSFSNWRGVSFVIRGMGQGFGPDVLSLNSSDALIGHRLLDRLAIKLPYQLPLTGSFSSKMAMVNISRAVDTGTPLDDEMLVSIGVARFLSGMPDGKASIIRVSTTSPDWLESLLSPETARFTLFDLHSSKSQVAQGHPLDISVGVRNWGSSGGSERVTFTDNGSVLAERIVTLSASSSTTVQESLVLMDLGTHTIQASVSGDFPVKLVVNVTVVDPYLQVSAPSRALLGSQFNVTVSTFDGSPARGASIQFDNQSVLSDTQGVASLDATHAGGFLLSAGLSGFTGGSARVEVVDPSTYPHAFQPTVVSFSVSPGSIKQSETSQGLVTVQNDGTEPGYLNLAVLVDSTTYETLNVSLQGMASESVSFVIQGLQPGDHIIQVGSFSVGLSVQSWYADNPGLVQLVIRYGGSTSLSSSASIPIYQAVKISEGNISVALFSIGAISALLASLAITSVFSKEIRQSRAKLGVLKTIGAPRSAIRALVFPQALWTGLAGALMGIGLGVLTVDILSRSSAFNLFGHQFLVTVDVGLLVIVLLAAVAISVASALASMLTAVQETTIVSIRDLEGEAGEPLDANELLSDD
jgi:ABC-type antimicrobial peptide transport system permease subunit